MQAQDVMQRDPVTATAEMTIEDAVRRLVSRRISGLPVVDPTGAVVGMLSEGDLLRRAELGTEAKISAWVGWLAGPGREARAYARSHARTVGEVMTAPVISVTPETDLTEVAALMESRHIKRLPVLQDGRLVGMLTRHDLVRALERLLPRANAGPVADAELRRRLLASLAEQGWAPRASFDVKVEDGIVELLGVVTDERQRTALRVLAENTAGVRGVVDHLLWIDPMSGIPLDPQPWSGAR